MTALMLGNVILGAFLASWVLSALWAERTVGSSSWREQAPLYSAGAAFIIVLAAVTWSVPAMRERLWPPNDAFDGVMLALEMAGIAWCWWARIRIGRLWSGGIVVKEGHTVVDTGPYAAVRHPIYSGAFLLVGALVIVKSRAADIVFFAGFVVFFIVKARMEERFLRSELGEAYERYSERVPMLVPQLSGLREALFARAA